MSNNFLPSAHKQWLIYKQSTAGSFAYSCSLEHGAIIQTISAFALPPLPPCCVFSWLLMCSRCVYMFMAGCQMICDVAETEAWRSESLSPQTMRQTCMNHVWQRARRLFTFHQPECWLCESDSPFRSPHSDFLRPQTANCIFHQIVLMGFNLTFALFLLLLACYNENSVSSSALHQKYKWTVCNR